MKGDRPLRMTSYRQMRYDLRERLCLCKSWWSYSEAELKKGRCDKCYGVCFPSNGHSKLMYAEFQNTKDIEGST